MAVEGALFCCRDRDLCWRPRRPPARPCGIWRDTGRTGRPGRGMSSGRAHGQPKRHGGILDPARHQLDAQPRARRPHRHRASARTPQGGGHQREHRPRDDRQEPYPQLSRNRRLLQRELHQGTLCGCPLPEKDRHGKSAPLVRTANRRADDRKLGQQRLHEPLAPVQE